MRKVKFLQSGGNVDVKEVVSKVQDPENVIFKKGFVNLEDVEQQLNNQLEWFINSYKGYGEFTDADKEELRSSIKKYLFGLKDRDVFKKDKDYYKYNTKDSSYDNDISRFRKEPYEEIQDEKLQSNFEESEKHNPEVKPSEISKNRNYSNNDINIIALSMIDKVFRNHKKPTNPDSVKLNSAYNYISQAVFGKDEASPEEFAQKFGDWSNENEDYQSNNGRWTGIRPILSDWVGLYTPLFESNVYDAIKNEYAPPSNFETWDAFKEYTDKILNLTKNETLSESGYNYLSGFGLGDLLGNYTNPVPPKYKKIMEFTGEDVENIKKGLVYVQKRIDDLMNNPNNSEELQEELETLRKIQKGELEGFSPEKYKVEMNMAFLLDKMRYFFEKENIGLESQRNIVRKLQEKRNELIQSSDESAQNKISIIDYIFNGGSEELTDEMLTSLGIPELGGYIDKPSDEEISEETSNEKSEEVPSKKQGGVLKLQKGRRFSNVKISDGYDWYNVVGKTALEKLYNKMASLSKEDLRQFVNDINDLQKEFSVGTKKYTSLEPKTKLTYDPFTKTYQSKIFGDEFLDDAINNPLWEAQKSGIIKAQGKSGDHKGGGPEGLWGWQTDLRTIIGKINSIPKDILNDINGRISKLGYNIFGDEGYGVNLIRPLEDPNLNNPENPNPNPNPVNPTNPDANPNGDPNTNPDSTTLNEEILGEASTVNENPLQPNLEGRKYKERSPIVDLINLGLTYNTINNIEGPESTTPLDPVRKNEIVTDNYSVQADANRRSAEIRNTAAQILKSNPEDYLARMTQISNTNEQIQNTANANREASIDKQRAAVVETEYKNALVANQVANSNKKAADAASLAKKTFRNQVRNKILDNTTRYLKDWAYKGDLRDRENLGLDIEEGVRNAMDELYTDDIKREMLNSWNQEEGNTQYETFEALTRDGNWATGKRSDGEASITANMSSKYISDLNKIQKDATFKYGRNYGRRTHLYDFHRIFDNGKLTSYLARGGRTYSERKWKEMNRIREKQIDKQEKAYQKSLEEYMKNVREDVKLSAKKDRDMAAFIASLYFNRYK